MKLLFFTAGSPILASSRTRVYQYLPYLTKEDIVSKVINFTSENECKANIMRHKRTLIKMAIDKIYSFLQVLKLLLYAPDYDIIFVQKVLLPNILQISLIFLNSRIIFDFDDAIFIRDIYKNDKFIHRFIHMVSHSKYVVLENDFTKDFTQRYNKNITVITGPIDVNRYVCRQESRVSDYVTVGWIGTSETVEYLRPLYGVFQTLSRNYKNLIIEIVGTKKIDMDGVNLITKEWHFDTEVRDLHDFDIGIMPLPDDDWSRGKGGYKLLQYMAIGIPCVASPVGINLQMIKDGINGYLVKTQNEWEEKLCYLIENPRLRFIMGQNGREIAVKNYSFESNIERLIFVLRQVYKNTTDNLAI